MSSKFLTLLLGLVLTSAQLAGQNSPSWPQFRGPNSVGIAAAGTAPPTEFAPGKRMLWKAPLQPGHSSPVVWGDRIFLTSADDATKKLETLCISAKDGSVLWRHAVTASELEYRFSVNGYASPSAVVDADRVYVYFGSYGLVALDHAGKPQWELKMPPPMAQFGTGTSPVVVGDFLVLNRDEFKGGHLLALDKRTGKEAWKAMYSEQPQAGFSKSTPVLWKDQLIVHRASSVDAYDAKTGKRVWWVNTPTTGASSATFGPDAIFVASWSPYGEADQRAPVPTFESLIKDNDKNGDGQLAIQELPLRLPMVQRPDVSSDIVGVEVRLNAYVNRIDTNRDGIVQPDEWTAIVQWFAERSRAEHGMIAIRPSGEGDISGQVSWRVSTSVPEVPSPLYYEGRVYMVRNGGIVTAMDAQSGKVLYRARLGAPGAYYSSPILAGGHLYIGSGEGVVTVWKPGDALEVVSRNDLGEPIFATPAAVGKRLYVRSESALYAFGEQD
jgi:outer membrane protein assembly factor BamB